MTAGAERKDMSSDLYERALATTEFVQARTDLTPRVAIILGTGLGALAGVIDVDVSIPYLSLIHI